MKINTILEMIASNREFLMQNSGIALDNLKALHRNFDSETDEACIMSLSLNDSIVMMRFHSDFEKSIQLSQSILAKYPDSPHPYFTAFHLKIIGRCMAWISEFENAENTLLSALKACNQVADQNDKLKLKVDILHDLAMANEKAQKDPQKSIGYLETALELFEGSSLEISKGICLMGLGILKFNIDHNEEALKYHKQEEQKFENNYSYPNLASAFNNLALCYNKSGQNEEAEKYLLRALDMRMTLGNKDEVSECYFNLGFFYDLMGRSDEAMSAMQSSYDYAIESTNIRLHKRAMEWMEKHTIAYQLNQISIDTN